MKQQPPYQVHGFDPEIDEEDPRRYRLEKAWQRIIGHAPDPDASAGSRPVKVLAVTCRRSAHHGDAASAPPIGEVWKTTEGLLYVTSERRTWDDTEYGSSDSHPGPVAPIPIIVHRHWIPTDDPRPVFAYCIDHGRLPISPDKLHELCVERGNPGMDSRPRAWVESVESVLDFKRIQT